MHGEPGPLTSGRGRFEPPTWTERVAFVVARGLAAGMLVVALSEEMPQLYDLLLRILVSLVAIWGCWFMPRLRRWGWGALFLITLVLFNPFAPPPFPPWLWRGLELACAALLVLSLAFIRPVPRPQKPGAAGPVSEAERPGKPQDYGS